MARSGGTCALRWFGPLAQALGLALGLLLAGCGASGGSAPSGGGAVSRSAALAAANDWAYLRRVPSRLGTPVVWAELVASSFDAVVVDAFHQDVSTGLYAPLSAELVAQLKASGGGRVVLAHMNVGEAEDHRYYWTSWSVGAPSFVLAEDVDRRGSYLVRYTDPLWHAVLMNPALDGTRGYLDRIMDAGFDGVYLGRVDSYTDLFAADHAYGSPVSSTYAQQMRFLVQAVAAYARARSPEFLIVPQNAPELLEDVPSYVSAIDGLGVEDTWYVDGEVASADRTGYTVALLSTYLRGKAVLAVDCFPGTLADPVDQFYAECRRRGFAPYGAGTRDFDQLWYLYGHLPD